MPDFVREAYPLDSFPSLTLHCEDQLPARAPGHGELGGPGQTPGITELFC